MTALPSGTVTFLFTDIEGSTRLIQQLGDRYPDLLAQHHRLLRAAFLSHGGHEFGTEGDALFVAFQRAADAVEAAVVAQRALASHPWPEGAPVRVRMALHTGEATLTSEGYVGLDLHRVARISRAGHGGQILLSESTRALVEADVPEGASLRDLGERRLKDLFRPLRLFQLVLPGLSAEFPPLHTLDARPNNLPAQPTPLVGREQETAAVAARLRRPEVRLVTLTGPGGTGKTRLGLQVAAELIDEYEHGVWLVELAPITEAGLFASAVAQVLGVREGGGRGVLEHVKEHLREKQVLLLLDNFEQILPAASQVADLLTAAPRLKMLATSRAILNLRGEHDFPVAPLAVPDPQEWSGVESQGSRASDERSDPRPSTLNPQPSTLLQYAAIELFLQRATAAKPEFALTEQTAPAVVEICRRLDGLPLAIELAAARVRLLSPQAMLPRLENRLKLLVGGARDLPARQQTLRDAIAWSYDLLEPQEQTLFRRLAVFVGGFTLEAAEAVCDADGDLGMDVLEGMACLMDKSLLRRQAESLPGGPRFGFLETIKEYGMECLVASGEAENLGRLHARYFLSLGEEAAPKLRTVDQAAWLDRLEAEHDNLRATLDWAVQRGEAESGLRLGAAIHFFWRVRGYYTEGRERLAALLRMAEASPRMLARAYALDAQGTLAMEQSDTGVARAAVEESLAISRELGDEKGIAGSLLKLGNLAQGQGDGVLARALQEESLALWRRLGDKANVAGALNDLGNTVARQGDLDGARLLYQESVAIFRELGLKRGTAIALSNLGESARLHANYSEAQSFLEESLAIAVELDAKHSTALILKRLGSLALNQGDPHRAAALLGESLSVLRALGIGSGVLSVLDVWSGVALAAGQPERAARLLGALHVLRGVVGTVIDPVDTKEHQRKLSALRAALGEERFAAAWEVGRAMTLEQAVAYALEEARGG